MPHLLYLAYGFPPAAKSSAYRMRATANLLIEAGWEVTAMTIQRDAWLRELGLDPSLEDAVDPRVRVVELPLARADLDPDLRNYGWFRARYPLRWIRWRRRAERLPFPEPVFGSWRRAFERGAMSIHGEHPVDLVLVSPAPYTQLAAAWLLHRRHGVPYVVDYRDGWSIDVIGGEEAFPKNSRQGRWESRVLAAARQVWLVNEPIRAFYAARYPELDDRLRVARNGFDLDTVPTPVPPRPDRSEGLVFGYLGTLNISVGHTKALLAGWRRARVRDPLVGRSRLEFRGHLGAGHARAANAHAQLIHAAADAAVSYVGPVPKREVGHVYAGWDAMVLALVGGRFVTSGKVYEYVATGLPVVSVHPAEHAAREVLDGYPLWVPTASLHPDDIADAFVAGAKLALECTAEQRLAARAHAERFERHELLGPVIGELASLLAPEHPQQVDAR